MLLRFFVADRRHCFLHHHPCMEMDGGGWIEQAARGKLPVQVLIQEQDDHVMAHGTWESGFIVRTVQ